MLVRPDLRAQHSTEARIRALLLVRQICSFVPCVMCHGDPMCIHTDPTAWSLGHFKTKLVSTQLTGRANTKTREKPFVLCHFTL